MKSHIDLKALLGACYPFTAVVGQDAVKIALIIGAIDPTIGGVLISGPKGSGKSLLVKSFSNALPDIERVGGCPFNCSPDDPTNMCQSCLEMFETSKGSPSEKAPMRIVQVPLSVTEDMLVGSIDLDRAVKDGGKHLRPGLLAEANQSILYVDEINLLPDHITDVILDAAASGWNTIEREGISVQHPSRFLLVGTMNPEEGELRPQLLDRFGLYAETSSIGDPELRALVLARNEDFTSDPSAFASKFVGEVEDLRSKIEAARKLLHKVEVSREIASTIANVCSRLRVDGFRPDIVAMKASRAMAAFHGRETVSMEDATSSLELALGHRTRRSGLAPPPSPTEIRRALGKAKRREIKLDASGIGGVFNITDKFIDRLKRTALEGLLFTAAQFAILLISTVYLLETIRSTLSPQPQTPLILLFEVVIGVTLFILLANLPRRRHEKRAVGALDLSKIILQTSRRLPVGERIEDGGTGSILGEMKLGKGYETTPSYGEKILRSMESFSGDQNGVKLKQAIRVIGGGGYSGSRRIRSISSSSRGRYASYQIPKGKPRDIAFVPTIMMATTHRKDESRSPRIRIERGDIRVKVREYRPPFSIVLLVDMSLSMIGSMGKLAQAIRSLHGRVYRRRDRVGLIIFKGAKAFTIQHPTANLDLIMEKLKKVGASDFTPMPAGLLEALKSLKREKLRNREAVCHLIVISDGIVNVPLGVPLSPMSRRIYTSEAQADCLDAARLIRKEGFKVHIANTNHSEDASPSLKEGWRLSLTPTQFLVELARVSGGTYQGLSLKGEAPAQETRLRNTGE